MTDFFFKKIFTGKLFIRNNGGGDVAGDMAQPLKALVLAEDPVSICTTHMTTWSHL